MAEYYRKVLSDETEYLNQQIVKFNAILDTLTCDSVDSSSSNGNSNGLKNNAPSSELIESVIGRIRLAIGQSKLFINERFKQFSGLIDDCELKRGEKEIKVEDLAGFWDMIYYQVEDLKTKYSQLESMERNNWVSSEPAEPALTNGATTNGTTTNGVKNKRAAINGAKTSTTGPKQNGAATNGAAKKPAVRSNFREFLKSKRNETATNA